MCLHHLGGRWANDRAAFFTDELSVKKAARKYSTEWGMNAEWGMKKLRYSSNISETIQDNSHSYNGTAYYYELTPYSTV